MKKELLANTRIANLAETQRQFGAYREFYNKGRPHHALNLDTPILKYTPSERLYPEKISQWEYPEDCKIWRVRGNGFFTCEGPGCFLSEAFAGKDIAIRPAHIHGCISLFFRNFRIGRIDVEKRGFTFRRIYLIEGDPRM